MKRFLRSIALFVPVALIVYAVLLVLWGDLMPYFMQKNMNYPLGGYGHMHTRLKEIPAYKNTDVVVLGSSHAYRGFDTRIFEQHGCRTFVLAGSAQTPVQTLSLVKRYLDTLNPKLVIYEVYPATFGSDGVESSVDLIANGPLDSLTVKMARQTDSFITYNTLAYAFYRKFTHKDEVYTEPVTHGSNTYITGGYVESPVRHYRNNATFEKDAWQLKDEQLEAFEEIVGMVKQRNIKLALVFAPIPQSLYNSYTNNTEFGNQMKAFGNYYDYNYLQLNDSLCFYDITHLNQNGVTIFNTELLKNREIFDGVCR